MTNKKFFCGIDVPFQTSKFPPAAHMYCTFFVHCTTLVSEQSEQENRHCFMKVKLDSEKTLLHEGQVRQRTDTVAKMVKLDREQTLLLRWSS